MHVDIRLHQETFETALQTVQQGEIATIPVSHTYLDSGDLVLLESPSSTRRLILTPRPQSGSDTLRIWMEQDIWMVSPLSWDGETWQVRRVVAMNPEKGIQVLPWSQHVLPLPQSVGISLGETLPPIFSRLRIMVVGTSRTGSHLAWALLRLRPEKLILVDPDVWEAHHRDVPALVLGESMMGRLKAVSLAEALEGLAREEDSPTQVVPVPRAIWDVPVDVLAEADIIVSAVDNLPARLYLDVTAEAFRALLLDVGVEASADDWGGAVRVFWPEGPRLRTVLPITPEHWQQLHRRSIPSTREPHGALPGIAQITAGMAQLVLLSAVEGGVQGGSLTWNWQTFTWDWQPWFEGLQTEISYLGRGKAGLSQFWGWLSSLFE